MWRYFGWPLLFFASSSSILIVIAAGGAFTNTEMRGRFIAISATDRVDIRGERLATVTSPLMLKPLDRLEIRLPGVSFISAKRDVVAVAAERPGKCGTIRLWSPRDRRLAAAAAGCYGAGGYNDISDLVLGRSVVAWVFSWGDVNSGSDCLMIRQVSTARIGRAITRKGHVCNVDYYGPSFGRRPLPAFESVANGGTSGAEGELLTSLQTVAPGILYSVESYCNANCDQYGNRVPKHTVTTYLVSAGGREQKVAGAGVRVVAAAANVVAAVRSNSLDLFDLGTRAWRTVSNGPVRAARIDGDKLFVLRPAGLLETFDLGSGDQIATQQLVVSGNTPVQLEDADSAFVVYVSNRHIHIQRTLDRKEVVLALQSKARMPLHAQIEPAGLYYSYNLSTRPSGRVGFVARTLVVRAFGP